MKRIAIALILFQLIDCATVITANTNKKEIKALRK
jgi:hypothetical protein